MSAFETRTLVTGSLLLGAALAGVLTTARGRPLNVLVSTVHKLLAVASVVFAVLLAIDVLHAVGARAPMILLLVSIGLTFAGIFATGALLSFDKLVSVPLRAAHAAIPFLVIAGMAVLAFAGAR